MKHSQVAHVWYSGNKRSGGRGNLFFRGDTIYSYGSHFPIARKVNGVLLFTTRTYSVSTQRHISYVRRAIPSDTTIFYVQDPSSTDYKGIHDEYRKRFDEALESASAPRIRSTTRESYISQAQTIADEANRFAKWAKLRRKPLALPDDVASYVVELREKNAHAEKRKLAKLREKRAAQYAEWKNGKLVRLHWHDASFPVAFRINGENVETSLGADFPIAHAEGAWRKIKAIYATASAWKSNGENIRLGHFKLDSIDEDGTIRAGCHTVTKSSILELAEKLGLN